jgi:putative protease
MVLEYDDDKKVAKIEQRNRVYKGETVEIFSPVDDTFSMTLDYMTDENGEKIDVAPHPQMVYYIRCEKKLLPYDMLIKHKEE